MQAIVCRLETPGCISLSYSSTFSSWRRPYCISPTCCYVCLTGFNQSIFTSNCWWKSTHFNRFRPDWSTVFSDNQWRVSSFTCGFLPQMCDPESCPQLPLSQTHRQHTEESRVPAPDSIKTEADASGKHPTFFATSHLKLNFNAIYSGSHFKVIKLIYIVKSRGWKWSKSLYFFIYS